MVFLNKPQGPIDWCPMSKRAQWVVRHLVLICFVSWFSGAMAKGQESSWESLLSKMDVGSLSVSGEWTQGESYLDVAAADGARIMLPTKPAPEYDLKITFTRRTGEHSIGVVLVHGNQQVCFEVDAWGKHLAGFQDVNGRTIQDNATRKENVRLVNGKQHELLLEVRKDFIRALLDGAEISSLKMNQVRVSVHPLWSIPQKDKLALLAWNSSTRFHSVQYKSMPQSGESVAQAATSSGNSEASRSRPSAKMEQGRGNGVVDRSTTSNAQKKGVAKRVLLVIANHHFFYREYREPRDELERAGIQVTVAAGRRGVCRPHNGSGEGVDGGAVRAEVALSEVKVDDYDAILFAGGWGASMYQFAFDGRYDESAYNGERAVKVQANRVINEFLAQKKYVAALCNGTSVLAWARVNGKSPLEGKLVCAPVREAAAGIYNGRRAQPSCRWHAEQNGARMSPPGAIGNPNTNVDDVAVDGVILTGEDDPSAREMGRKLAELLTNPDLPTNTNGQ